MERNEVSAWRAKYLHAVEKNYKSPQPRPLIYLDETYIHSSHTSVQAFESITVSEWTQHCNHVRKLQGEYLKHDVYLDKPFIIDVASDSETESDSDNDDMDISGVWSHSQDEIGHASSSKDHNYCKPGF
ncbi:hypothetical protein ACJJTC_011116 [Scirpophaga incertulas]